MFVYVRYTHSHTNKQMLFLLTFDCDGDEWVNDGDFDYFIFFLHGARFREAIRDEKMSGWEEGGNARRKCCIRFDDWWLVKYSDRKIYFYVGVRFHSVFIICQFCENLI